MKNNARKGFILFLLISNISMAEVISSVADEITMTVYRDDVRGDYYELHDSDAVDAGLVMITETRSLDLDAGHNQITFHGVADGIIPQTAKLEQINGNIIESNFNYSLMTPDELIAKSIDKTVKIQRTDSATGEVIEKTAIIRAQEKAVVLEIDGKFEALNCSGEIEKIIFSSVPPSLITEPTLSSRVNIETAGSYQVKLSYLAVGVQWKADYVATVNAKNKTMDLMAWLTLVNARSTNFANVPVQVIAGKIERDESETVPPVIWKPEIVTQCWPTLNLEQAMYSEDSGEEIIVTGMRASIVKSEEFADYKLYSFPHKTTLNPKQSKQVILLSQKNVPFESRYLYEFSIEDILDDAHKKINVALDLDAQHPVLELHTENSETNNLGISLPEGDVVVNEQHNDRSVMIGEAYTRDVPVGLAFKLKLEETPDVVVIVKVLGYEEKDEIIQVNLEFEVTNHKSKRIDFRLQQRMPELFSLLEVIDESIKHQMEYGMLSWSFRIGAHDTKKLQIKLKFQDLF